MTPKQMPIQCTGYSIEADLYEGEHTRPILLTFVGFSSSKASNSSFVSEIVERTGLGALVVDLSGHGESPFVLDETTPAQHLLEAVKAYDWLAEQYPGRSIYVMGTSYGGFMGAYLSRFRAVQKLILRTPAIYEPKFFYTEHKSIDKIASRVYRKDVEALGQHPLFLQPPLTDTHTLLIVHGNDESVPVQTTDAYQTVFKAETYVAEGFVHAFRDASNPQDGIGKYYDTIERWTR